MEKSVLSKGKGAWAAGLVSGDPAERSCGLAGALLSHRVEKSSVYGIFLCGSPLLCGGAREAAGDRKNEVSGPTFPERKIEGVYRDGGFREPSRGTCDGKAGQHYRSGRCERVWERAGRRPDDPVPGGRDKKRNASGNPVRPDGDHGRRKQECPD